MEKHFISAQDLLDASFALALTVYESGYRPSHILGVWRGGAPIAIAVHEALAALGWPAAHYAVQAASYGGETDSKGKVDLFGLEAICAQLSEDNKVLIVDDIFDTGLSVETILGAMKTHCKNRPQQIKIAAAYYKPARNQTPRGPDYYVHSTDSWAVFPHELIGCSDEELARHKRLPEAFLAALKRERGF